MALPVCSSFLRVLPNYMRVVYQREVFVAKGLWSGRIAGLVGRRRSLAGGAVGCPRPRYGVPLSTCAWPPAPAIAGGLHRWTGGYRYTTKAHRDVVIAVGAVDLDWPSQAAKAFGGAS